MCAIPMLDKGGTMETDMKPRASSVVDRFLIGKEHKIGRYADE